jgi:hypothetical protein
VGYRFHAVQHIALFDSGAALFPYAGYMPALPVTECEIDAFIAAFEGCTLPKEEWTHGAHLLTGACYVHALGEPEAIERMRLCVRRYNESVGGKNSDTSGYHETITVAWIKLLNSLLERSKPIARATFAALAVEHFREQKNIFRRYYDFDLVASTEARRSWVAPTLRPLELSETLD